MQSIEGELVSTCKTIYIFSIYLANDLGKSPGKSLSERWIEKKEGIKIKSTSRSVLCIVLRSNEETI